MEKQIYKLKKATKSLTETALQSTNIFAKKLIMMDVKAIEEVIADLEKLK